MTLSYEAAFQLGQQFIQVLIMVTWAWLYPSIGALVGGTIISSFIAAIASHFLLPGTRNRFAWNARAAADADVNDNHTFLFIADRKTVIDATRGGNESRFINHSCDGNCTSETEKGRVFIDAIKDIAKGEELGYDYQIPRDKDDPPNVDRIYGCRCGSPKCRGSMLWPPLKKKGAKKSKQKAKASKATKRASARRVSAKQVGAKRTGASRKTRTGRRGKSAPR
jgi:hypothetical protein